MEKISARDTLIAEIAADEAEKFLKENHRQEIAKPTTTVRSLGMFNNDELVGVAQFCYPRTAGMRKKYTVELLRLGFKKDRRVQGGASKMLKHYIKEYNPADLFTYQDTTGEAGDVYAHAGMTLASERKTKKYLVAPGKTLETAERGEYYSIGEVSRRGPDALLGTKLGEVFRANGKRKTNPELFIEELGWHIEETKGDRVWEWVNPNVSFYVYKITASDSDKYYIGVKQLNKANVTVEDCLKDSYMGSGGYGEANKFNNWKKKHKTTLQKEILSIHSRKVTAYEAEKKAIGDKYKTDPLCLNSISGGAHPSKFFSAKVIMKYCNIHAAETKHMGGKCHKCSMDAIQVMKECSTHGLTPHNGEETCWKCRNAAMFTIKKCPRHGEVKHQKDGCSSCHMENMFSLKWCVKCKAETNHKGDSCHKCSMSSLIHEAECVYHGMTAHKKNRCMKCLSESFASVRYCNICDKETNHQGKSCRTCAARKTAHRDYHAEKAKPGCYFCEHGIDTETAETKS